MNHKVWTNGRKLRRLFVATIALFSPVLIGISFLPIEGMAQSDCRQVLTMNRDPESAKTPIPVLMGELQKNPENYYGKTVTVDGELHRTFTETVFTIEGDGFFRDKDILVVGNVPKAEAAIPLEHSLEDGKEVRVTGLVQPYDRGRLECAYGPLHLESREGHSFTKNPVLIVERAEPKIEIPSAQLEKPMLPAPLPEPEAVIPAPAQEETTVAAAEPAKMPESLPRTAGHLPMLAVAGLLALYVGLLKSNR